MQDEAPVSPYLKRPLRSLEEVLRKRRSARAYRHQLEEAPLADNSNRPLEVLPPAKSA